MWYLFTAVLTKPLFQPGLFYIAYVASRHQAYEPGKRNEKRFNPNISYAKWRAVLLHIYSLILF